LVYVDRKHAISRYEFNGRYDHPYLTCNHHMFTTGKLRLSKEEMKKLKARLTQLRSSNPVWEGGSMVPPGPRPPGPERWCPKGWGRLEVMCRLPSGDPTNRSGR